MVNDTGEDSITNFKTNHVVRRIAAAISISTGVIVLLSWIHDWENIRQVFHHANSVKANTAIVFVLVGLSMWIATLSTFRARLWAFLPLALGTPIALFALGQEIFDLPFNIDEIFLSDTTTRGLHRGRMAPTAALAFLFLAASISLSTLNRQRMVSNIFATVAGLLGLHGVLVFLFDSHMLPTGWVHMAVITGLNFMVLGLAALFEPESFMLRIMRDRGPAGMVAWRVILPTVIALPLAAWLQLLGEKSGYYDTGYGLALGVTAQVGALSALSVWSAITILRVASIRKAGEERIRCLDAELHELRKALEHAAGAVARFDAEGKYVSVNPVYANMLNCAPADLVGKPADLACSDDRDAQRAALERMRADGKSVVEVRRIGADGLVRVENQTFVATPDVRGGYKGHLLIVEDITAKRRLEQQLVLAERLASVGTLAAGVAHEINNPLTYIIVNMDFVSKGLLEWNRQLSEAGGTAPDVERSQFLLNDFHNAIQDAASGAERVRSIVKDLKVFARDPDNSKNPVSVRSVLESTINVTWSELRQHARLINNSVDSPRVNVNESRLAQVFLNILLNAVQALPAGQTERNLITVNSRPLGDEVVVEITDNGSGISPENLKRVFDPFFTTKTVGLGTGLGLSICHGIVQSLGGRMEVESELGQGSTFRVFLPCS